MAHQMVAHLRRRTNMAQQHKGGGGGGAEKGMPPAMLPGTPWCQGILSAPHTWSKNPLAYLCTRPANSAA